MFGDCGDTGGKGLGGGSSLGHTQQIVEKYGFCYENQYSYHGKASEEETR